MDLEALKEKAAIEALREVVSGQRLGLGTGSTIAWFLKHLGKALAEGRLERIVGVPTSERTAILCRDLGIPTTELDAVRELDLAVDGADEVSPTRDLVKGLGGALLREKMVAAAARRFVVIADGTKRVARLGEKAPVPVEVVPFAWRWHLPWLIALGGKPELRLGKDGEPVRTDNGNLVIDCRFLPAFPDPRFLARTLSERPGVVGHGLFLGMCQRAYLATTDGVVIL